MKKIVVLFTLTIFTLLSAGPFSWVASTGDKTLNSKAEQLETYGQNPRVYEFRKTFSSGMVVECIAVAKDEGVGVWCHPLPKK